MSIISRITTWTIGQVLKAADLNGEFSNITNLLNNLDAATTTWTNVKTTTLTPTNVGPFTATGAIAMGTNKITGLGNGTATQDATTYSQLQYLQAAVQASITTASATTSSTYQATGLTANITPTSASSRIKITVTSVGVTANVATSDLVVTIKRGATDLGGSLGMSIVDTLTYVPVAISFIDSPATTSSTTYAAYIKSQDNATTVTLGATNVASTIILEELR